MCLFFNKINQLAKHNSALGLLLGNELEEGSAGFCFVFCFVLFHLQTVLCILMFVVFVTDFCFILTVPTSLPLPSQRIPAITKSSYLPIIKTKTKHTWRNHLSSPSSAVLLSLPRRGGAAGIWSEGGAVCNGSQTQWLPSLNLPSTRHPLSPSQYCLLWTLEYGVHSAFSKCTAGTHQ